MTEQSQAQPKKRGPILFIIAGIVGICFICLVGSTVMNSLGIFPTNTPSAVPTETLPPEPTETTLPTGTPPATLTPAQTYLEKYGGDLESYQEIFDITDCALLQEQFDIAASNHDRYEAGTLLFEVTLGYMVATDQHMQDIGCY